MVTDEVYEALKRMKWKGESFSDVIKRLLKFKPRLMEIAGSKTISRKDWERVKKELSYQRELDEVRRRYLLELIGK
ncbi:MAG: antitoxin VapB family protein [Candidatus Freyarchaeota archaeon]